MRKLVSFLLIVFTLTMFFAIPVSAKAPSSAWDTGYYDLWYVNSTRWANPGNVSVDGNVNTYYQWFYTYIPFFHGLTYDVPFLIYTYDGSMVDGQNPTLRYALRLSQDDSRNVTIEYIKISSGDVVTVVSSNTYRYSVSYSEMFTFCGWGMDKSGSLYYLIDLDGNLNYVRVASSPNGDKHLYAAPNNFDGLYIMGFNLMDFGGLIIDQSNVVWCYEYLLSQVENTTIFKNWIDLLEKLSGLADPILTDHFFEVYSPRQTINLGDVSYLNQYDPSKPLRENVSANVVYDKASSAQVSVFDQSLFEDGGPCVYEIHVSQTIIQYQGSSDYHVDYSITIVGKDPEPIGGVSSDFFVLAYADSFETASLFGRLRGVTFRPKTCSYPLDIVSEIHFPDAPAGSACYERVENVKFQVSYEYLRSGFFKLYLVSDGSGWASISQSADYVDKLQQSYIDKYEDYINNVFIDLDRYHLTFSGNDVISQLFGIPSMMYLVSLAASLIIVKVVLYK